jgi:hypothetical protein
VVCSNAFKRQAGGMRRLLESLTLCSFCVHEIERIKLHRQSFATERPVEVAKFV